MKIKNYDYKYLLILVLAVLIIGNGCGIFGGVRLYEGASGKKEEGDTTKKKVKKSNSPMGVGVPKSKKHVKLYFFGRIKRNTIIETNIHMGPTFFFIYFL